MRWLKLLSVAALIALAGGAGVTEAQPVGCAKYSDAAKRDACQKRESELKASREAKRQARAAKTKESQERIRAACTGAADNSKCVREETAKLKAKGAKGKDKDKPKKAN